MDESLDLITPLQKYSPEKQLKKKRKEKKREKAERLLNYADISEKLEVTQMFNWQLSSNHSNLKTTESFLAIKITMTTQI